MFRATTLGSMLLLVLILLAPADLLAQSKEDTIVYALRKIARPGKVAIHHELSM